MKRSLHSLSPFSPSCRRRSLIGFPATSTPCWSTGPRLNKTSRFKSNPLAVWRLEICCLNISIYFSSGRMQDNPALSKEASPSHLQAIFVQFNKFPNWYARWVLNCAPQFNSLGRDHLYSPPRFPSFFASLTFPPATHARRRRRGGSYLSLFLPSRALTFCRSRAPLSLLTPSIVSIKSRRSLD